MMCMRVTGTCHIYFTFDIGFAVGLAHVERLVAEDKLGQAFKRPRRAPEASQLPRHSARLMQRGATIAIETFLIDPNVEITIWEFGAATVAYRARVDAELTELVTLADELWDHPGLMSDARRRANELLVALGAAIDKPGLSGRVEDYVVFELRLPEGTPIAALLDTHAATVASILRAEPAQLAQEEIADALSVHCAYLPDEIVLIDWFAALLVGDDMEDERRVLEAAVAELLELRYLDEQLDRGIDDAHAVLRKARSAMASLSTRGHDLNQIAQLQADAAVLFEGVDNALKLLGDQYLARLYRAAAGRFHVPQWTASIERKLKLLDGIYDKLATRATSLRLELLEVIVIVLIAVSALIPFFFSY
jgi:hypothetical protein